MIEKHGADAFGLLFWLISFQEEILNSQNSVLRAIETL
jgi:hypothetical protein